MSVLCLNRMGTVVTRHRANNQCKVKGQHLYAYHVRVDCPANSINPKTRFIVDHAVINRIITDLFRKEISSCEQMCIDIAKVLKDSFEKSKVFYTNIYIKLSPVLPDNTQPVAFMEYYENQVH